MEKLHILPLKRSIGRLKVAKNQKPLTTFISQEFLIEQMFVEMYVTLDQLKQEYLDLKNS